MLKLELVRWYYREAMTCGLLHSRDGWSCFTGESVVVNDIRPPKGSAALPEGLYQLKLRGETFGAESIGVYDCDPARPVAAISLVAKPALAHGDIGVGMSLDLVTGTLGDTDHAYAELLKMVTDNGQVFIAVRHLDNTQLSHFERQRSRAKS